MRREKSIDPDDLNRPEGNDLVSNYDKHDTAEGRVRSALESAGLTVENWGIDMRHDDGDGLIFDDKMDLKVYASTWNGEEYADALVGIVEVKYKSNDYYMFKINRRHWRHYVQIAAEHDVPTYIVFDNGEMLHWCRVSETLVMDTFAFPDGNKGVLLSNNYYTTHEAVGCLLDSTTESADSV